MKKIVLLAMVLILLPLAYATEGGDCTCVWVGGVDTHLTPDESHLCSSNCQLEKCGDTYTNNCICENYDPDVNQYYCENCQTDVTNGDNGIKYGAGLFDDTTNYGTANCCGDDSNEFYFSQGGGGCCD